MGVCWAFYKTVKEAILSWNGFFMGKKRKKIWDSIPLCIFFLSMWKERNRIVFKHGDLVVQRLKYSFVYNLWSWNMVFLDEEVHSIIDFFFRMDGL